MKHKFKKQIDAFKAERKFKSSNEYKRMKERAEKIQNILRKKYTPEEAEKSKFFLIYSV